MEHRLTLEACGACEECREGLICRDARLAGCCEADLEEAIDTALDEASEGMADPAIKAEVLYAVTRAIAAHRCDETPVKRPPRRSRRRSVKP